MLQKKKSAIANAWTPLGTELDTVSLGKLFVHIDFFLIHLLYALL